MDLFDVLNLIGGLSLFLFGMTLMGQALERRAGNKLKVLLGRMTTNRFAGLLTGLVVTAIIQSSSATTVMVVGFVNSGLMTLKQSINVILGANIGTTVTAWILSLAGIESSNFFIRLLKPTSFTPILALVGISFYMMSKDNKRKDTGMILLGFATLMFGMDAMSGAVSGLRDVPGFRQAFLAFTNPVLGVIAGAVALQQPEAALFGVLFVAIFGGVGGFFAKLGHYGLHATDAVLEQGAMYLGKIYGYDSDYRVTMNGRPCIVLIVRYLELGQIREARVTTGEVDVTNYPRGATVSIKILNGTAALVPGSVSNMRIEREDDLLNPDFDPTGVHSSVGVSCPNCGANIVVPVGMSRFCPYCNSKVSVGPGGKLA